MSTQRVTVTLSVEDVDAFPSAEESARELATMLDPKRYTVTRVVVRDAGGVRVDDEWTTEIGDDRDRWSAAHAHPYGTMCRPDCHGWGKIGGRR